MHFSRSPPKGSSRSNRTRSPPRLAASSAIAAGLALVGAPSVDGLPRAADPPRFAREVSLPVGPAYRFPVFSHFAFYEESGAFREAFASLGYAACSVSERPTTRPPSAHCVHYVGSVQQFVQQYPYPLGLVVTHVTCTALTSANRPNWQRCFADGSMRASALEFVWAASLGERNASENPPGVLDTLVGAPSVRTNACDHGCPLSKQWCWWLRGLPAVPPSCVIPPEQRMNGLSGLRGVDADSRMLLRSATPPSLAAAHATYWDAAPFVPGVFTPSSPALPPDNAVTLECEAHSELGTAVTAGHFDPKNDSNGGHAAHEEVHTVLAAGRPVRLACGACAGEECACVTLASWIRRATLSAWVEAARVADNVRRRATQLRVDQAVLAHRLVLFGARYAPSVPDKALRMPGCVRHVIVVPTSAGKERTALVSLNGECFAAPLRQGQSATSRATEVATFLPHDMEPVMAAIVPSAPHHYVYLAPSRAAPLETLHTPASVQRAARAGNSFAWCTAGALTGHVLAHTYALYALQHLRSLGGPTSRLPFRIGTWSGPRPVLQSRSAALWRRRLPDSRGDASWESTVAADTHTVHALRQALENADNGDGLLARFADCCRGIQSYQRDLPLAPPDPVDPAQEQYRMAPLPERPLPLVTEWLVRAPPQPVPPGYKPMAWKDLIRTCGRRLILECLNADADRQFQLWSQRQPTTSRKPYLVLGPHMMRSIPHADGIGAWRSTDIIWRLHGDGLFHAMDFTEMLEDHKNRDALWSLLGGISDQELLSLIFDGVRWKISPPRQVRIANNLMSLDTHLKSVSQSISKLVREGLYHAVPLRGRDDPLQLDGPPPLLFHPNYTTGKGGVPKKDNPAEARPVGDSGAPHGDVRERNHPHQDTLEDAVAVPINDLTGPSKAPPGYSQPQLNYPYAHGVGPFALPWPDPEVKMRPRHLYRALVVLRHLAHVGRLPLVGASDDVRWMFFQFYLAPEELWLSTFHMVLDTHDGPRYHAVSERVTNMGTRPMSKIACRFSEEFLTAWRSKLDAYVASTWLPQQSSELKNLLAARRSRLGPSQARPYWAAPFTDDIVFAFVGIDLAVAGLHLWTAQCASTNVWMSQKKGCGTVIDWIGGRYVLSAGWGCLTPAKRARAVADSTAAIDNQLTRDELEAHNSFLVHVHDILDMPKGALQGLRAPLKYGVAPGSARAIVQGSVAEQRHRDIIAFLDTVACAPFTCAMPDAELARENPSTVWQRLASDACTGDDAEDPALQVMAERGATSPHVCGVADGIVWVYPLDTEWRRRHITVIEGVGPALNVIVFAPIFPRAQLVLETDATAAAASVLWRARSDDMAYIQRRLAQQPEYAQCEGRLWVEACAGERNQLSDAGSRGKWNVLADLAAAFGLRLRFLSLPTTAIRLLDDVLRHTTPLSAAPASDGLSLLEIIQRTAPSLAQYVGNDEPLAADVGPGSGWTEEPSCASLRREAERTDAVVNLAADILRNPHRTAHVRAALHGRPLKCRCARPVCSAHALALIANAAPPDVDYLRRKAVHHHRERRRAALRQKLQCNTPRRPRAPYGGEADEVIRFPFTTPPQSPEDIANRPTSQLPSRRPCPFTIDAASRRPRSSSPSRPDDPAARIQACANSAPPRRPPSQERLSVAEDLFARARSLARRPPVVHSDDAQERQATLSPPAQAGKTFPDTTTDDPDATTPAGTEATAHSLPALPHERAPTPGVHPEDFVARLQSASRRPPLAQREAERESTEDALSPSPQTERSGSPQPTSAAAARAAAARHLARDLTLDASPDALYATDPIGLAAMCAESARAISDGIPRGTRKADEWGFRWMMRFCQQHGTRWMRPRVVPPELHAREAWLAAFALMWLATAMGASARREARGFTQAKASSCLLALYAWRRVQRDCGRHTCDMRLALRSLRGLNAQYRLRWGDMALVPEKRQPFSLKMLHAMAAALRSHKIAGWSAELHLCMLALVTFCLSTGMRRDEWSNTGDASYMRRSNFAWFKGNSEITPDAKGLGRLHDGDYLRAKSNPSKCDRDNVEWGSKDMWFRVDHSNPLNFAAVYLNYERTHPCEPDRRGSSAAFSPTGGSQPFAYSTAATRLDHLMQSTIGDKEARTRSWHAFRVTIACALLARAGSRGPEETDALTQVLVRWKTTASVRCYSQLSASSYADHVDEVTRTDAHPHRHAEICDLDASAGAIDLNTAIEELENDLGEAKRTRAPREKAASASTKELENDLGETKKTRAKKGCADDKKTPRKKAASASKKSRTPARGQAQRDTTKHTEDTRWKPGDKAVLAQRAYPKERCTENDKRGWTVRIVDATQKWAKVEFEHARGSNGQAFAPIYVKHSLLTPLRNPQPST